MEAMNNSKHDIENTNMKPPLVVLPRPSTAAVKRESKYNLTTTTTTTTNTLPMETNKKKNIMKKKKQKLAPTAHANSAVRAVP